MTGIFKAYDIRGIYPTELNEDTAHRIGQAYATYVKKKKIAVDMDMRLSSQKLKDSLIKGLIDQGCDVTDIGLVSTPTFYFAVANYEFEGGIQVSASHNPAQYNGFKMVLHDAIPIGEGFGMEEIETLVKANKFVTQKKGTLKKMEHVLDEQIKHDLSYSNHKTIKPLKVVCDAANAMGAQYLEALFKNLPCKLVKMNFTLDGTFPSHEADPLKEENLHDLQKKVKEEKADIGISTDGDGDRIFFVDNTGAIVPQQIIRGLLAKIFLREHPKSTICYDIRPGKITKDMIEEAGGKAIVTRVGHSLIKAKMREVNALFGGESSGHFFLKMDKGTYEAPAIVCLKILEEISNSNKTFSEIIKPYDKYFHSGEINSEVHDKQGKMDELEQKFKKTAKEISKLDGITIDMGDYWFNVRPSNTENKLRLNLEAVSKKIMEQKRDEVLKIIRP